MSIDPRIEQAILCGKDPLYFINNYCKISHPLGGAIPFKCYDFQEQCIKDFQKHRFNIILKSRQLGISTISSAYAAWLALFHPSKSILIISTTREISMLIIDKIKFVLQNLPPYLLLKGTKSETKQSITFNNGSSIKAVSSSPNAARGHALSCLIIDEAAIIKDFEEIFQSALPTLNTGGSAIILSTPKGVGNRFHKLYIDAEAGLNNFNPIKLKWDLIPEHDMKWFLEETKGMSRQQVAQELECNFESSVTSFVPEEQLAILHKLVTPPKDKLGIDRNIWIWKDPEPGDKYLISADVSRGDAEDYSTFHIINISKSEVVAEYKGKIPTDNFAYVLAEFGTLYNNAMLAPENKSYGFTTIKKLRELGYSNIYHSKKNFNPLVTNYSYSEELDEGWGFDTNASTRFRALSKLEVVLRNKQLEIHSSRFLEELKTFIFNQKKNKWEAMKGYNDDLILSLAIGVFLFEPTDEFLKNEIEMNKAILRSMSVSVTEISIIKQSISPGAPAWSTANIPKYQDNLDPNMNQQKRLIRDTNAADDFSWVYK